MKTLSHKRVGGFTLIELLIVIAVIGVLIGLLIPAVQKVREMASRAECGNHLKQIALAVAAFENVEGRIPYNQFGSDYGNGPDSDAWSWLARLLPYVEQKDLYAHGQIPSVALDKSLALSQQIALYLCPSDFASSLGPRRDAGNLDGYEVGQTNYKGVGGANWGDDLEGDGGAHFPTNWRSPGTNGSFDGHSQGDGIFYRTDYKRPLKLSQIRDGTSNTFMVGEDVPQLTWWCSWPYANNANGTCAIPPNVKQLDGKDYPPWNWQNNESFRSRHPGGLQFAYADGSVHYISNNIDLDVYHAMATISGGEVVEAP